MQANNDLAVQLLCTAFKFNHIWFSAFMPQISICRSEFITLCVINEKSKKDTQGIKISDLARFLGQAVPSVTQRLNTLEASGYIMRASDTTDRRVCYAKITAQGKQIIADAQQQIKAHMQLIVDDCGCEDISKTISYMNKLSDAMCRHGNKKCHKPMPQIWQEDVFKGGE